MKKDKLKKIRLLIQTQEPVGNLKDCVLMMSGLQLEMRESMRLSVADTCIQKFALENGLMASVLEAKGVQSDNEKIRHLRAAKQAGILDYGYFMSRLSETVITDIEAEIFDFRRKVTVPFEVKKLEFIFASGKKIDLTDRISVYLLDKLAS